MNKKNKTFFIISGSGNTFVWFRMELLKSMQKRGYRIYAASPEISRTSLDILESHNISHIQIKLSRKSFSLYNLVSSIFELLRIYKEINPDIVLSYMHKSIIAANIAAQIHGVKSIFSMITGLGHVYYDSSIRGNVVRKITNMLLKIALKNTKKVFFQNHDNYSVFLKNKILEKSKGKIINGSGINLDQFPETPLPSKIRFITIARLLKSKGLIEYAQAAKLVKEKYPDSEFLIYGYEDDHEDSITEHQIKNEWEKSFGVKYMGYCSNVYKALSDCYCFVLLSHHEGMPRTVLEAMSVGRPIITTNAPGCIDTVKENKNGYVVPVGDYHAAAKAMIKVIEENVAMMMARASRSFAQDRFDVNKVNADIISELI